MKKNLELFGFKIEKIHIIGLIIALVIVILSFIFILGSDLFYFLLGISFVIAGLPFFLSLLLESSETKEKESMFLEFARDLVESVRMGTPINQSILNVRKKNYGSLSIYIDKLANQISLGIPVSTAFETFAREINSPTISRAVNIIRESEKAGGEIENILESVASSVSQIEQLRKERRAAMNTLVVQGYIIFFIFIGIMLVMEFKILPITSGLGDISMGDSSSQLGTGFGGLMSGGKKASPEELTRPFIWLLVMQGFFAGLVIGKLSEGKIRYGIKHSFIFVVMALLINAGAKLLFGE